MSAIQIDWLGVLAFIMPPIAYLVSVKPYSRKDDAYYTHISESSPLFPKGKARIIFSLAWTCIYVLEGVAMYLFWRNADTSTTPNGNTYNAGLVLYLAQLLMTFAWMNIFKPRYPRWISFIVTVIIMLCVIGVLVCSVLLSITMAIVVFSIFTAWMTYATILSFIVTFYVPAYKDPEGEPVSALPAYMEANGKSISAVAAVIPAAAASIKPISGKLRIPGAK